MQKNKKEEMLSLSEECLEDIELSKIPLSQICLKAKRLARLSGDEMHEKAFYYEVFGYASPPDGIPLKLFEIAKFSKRITINIDKTEEAYTRSIDQILIERDAYRCALTVSADPNISISSSNPYQHVPSPEGNQKERKTYLSTINILERQCSERKAFIHDYIMTKNIELKFKDDLNVIKNNLTERVAKNITKYLPDGIKKISSMLENLKSENPENWSLAATTIRRILADLAKKINQENNSDRYYEILKKCTKDEHKGFCDVHIKFIVDEANKGTHQKARKEGVEKLLLHVCLFLDSLDWTKIDSHK